VLLEHSQQAAVFVVIREEHQAEIGTASAAEEAVLIPTALIAELATALQLPHVVVTV
jgi:hypothetical protein